MAFTIDFAGLEEIEKMLLQNAEAAESKAEQILLAGAEVLVKAQKAALSRISKGSKSDGELLASIGIGKIKKSKSGSGYHTEVFPQGTQSHISEMNSKGKKVRNANVGFMVEYGTSNMTARPWVSVAEATAADAVNEAMGAEWERASNG
ncbi:MAG: HK97 gp10 family phage protein [Defluviitaleaceae bacterium]|nr:HK97 gp10 family phage protein [Defluviitaleaceae bacterium]